MFIDCVDFIERKSIEGYVNVLFSGVRWRETIDEHLQYGVVGIKRCPSEESSSRDESQEVKEC